MKICSPIHIDPRFRVGYITMLIEDGERLDLILVQGEMSKKVGVYEGRIVITLEYGVQQIDETQCISLEELEKFICGGNK